MKGDVSCIYSDMNKKKKCKDMCVCGHDKKEHELCGKLVECLDSGCKCKKYKKV